MRTMSVARRSAFAAAGQCVQCGAPRDAAGGLFCTTHIFKQAAYRWLSDVTRWRDLRTAFERQGARCVYTGEALVLGINASVDHKTPRSRGGANELANLQWVTWGVNRSKRDLTHDEFVSMCRCVTERVWLGIDAHLQQQPLDGVFECGSPGRLRNAMPQTLKLSSDPALLDSLKAVTL
jgi:hypothetical protein